jgi:hypothetical protein
MREASILTGSDPWGAPPNRLHRILVPRVTARRYDVCTPLAAISLRSDLRAPPR